MSCSHSGAARWPSSQQCFGHGVCQTAAANLTAADAEPGMCVCDAGWSSSGDFIYSPLAQCHIRQDVLLALWSLAVLVVLLSALTYARVLRAYGKQLPLRRRYEPVQLPSQVSSMKTTTTIKLRPAGCGIGERVYRRVCWVLRSPMRCCLLGVFMLLLLLLCLSVLKVITIAMHLDASSTDRVGRLIGLNWMPTVLYVVSSLAFLATGHCSTMLWCASARAFDPRPIEGAALRASTQRELWVASAVHCACYAFVFIATGFAHKADWWHDHSTYELLVSLHFQIKAVIPLVCWITDRRITSKLLAAMLVHSSPPPAAPDMASKHVIPSKITNSGGGGGSGGGGHGGLASGLGGGGGGSAGGVSVLAVAGSGAGGLVSRKPTPLVLASEADPASSMKKLSWDKGVDTGTEAKLSKSKSGGGVAASAATGVQMATLSVDSPSNRADRRNSQQLLHAGRNRRPSLDIGPVRLTPYEPRTSLSQHSPRSPRTMLSSNVRRARRSSDRLHFNFSPRQQPSVPALPLSPPHLAMDPANSGPDAVNCYSPSSTPRGGAGTGAGNPHFQLLAPAEREMDASHPPSSTLLQPSPRHPAGSTLSVQGSHSKAALSADLTVNFASSFAMHSRNVSSSMQMMQAMQLQADTLLPGQLHDSVEYLPRCIDDAASPTVQTRTLGFIDSPFSVSNRMVDAAPPLPAGDQALSLLTGYRIPRPVVVHAAHAGAGHATDAVGSPGIVAASASDHSDSDDEADAEEAAYCIRISGVERVNTVKKLREHLYSQQQQQQQQQQRAEHQSGASAVAAAILSSTNAAAAAAATGTPSPASSPPAAASSAATATPHHQKPLRTISFATSEAEDAAATAGSINGSSAGGGGEGGGGGFTKLSPALERIIAAAESRRGTSSSKAGVSSKAPGAPPGATPGAGAGAGAGVTTGRQHKLPSVLSRSRSHGVLTSFGVAAGVAPLRSQTKLLTLQRARLIEFASRLEVRNRSTAVISLVWLVACSCFAWIPFMRAMVSYVMPLQAVATLLAVRTFLHTHSPLARRAGGLSHKARPFVGSQQSRPPTGLVLGDQRLGTRLEGDASAMPTHTHAGGAGLGGPGVGVGGGAVSGLGPLHTQKGVTMLVRGGHAPERSNLHTNSRFHRFASSAKHDEIVSQARAPSPSLGASHKA